MVSIQIALIGDGYKGVIKGGINPAHVFLTHQPSFVFRRFGSFNFAVSGAVSFS